MKNKEKLVNQLFIGKVCEIIGVDKTLELLKEANDSFKESRIYTFKTKLNLSESAIKAINELPIIKHTP